MLLLTFYLCKKEVKSKKLFKFVILIKSYN